MEEKRGGLMRAMYEVRQLVLGYKYGVEGTSSMPRAIGTLLDCFAVIYMSFGDLVPR